MMRSLVIWTHVLTCGVFTFVNSTHPASRCLSGNYAQCSQVTLLLSYSVFLGLVTDVTLYVAVLCDLINYRSANIS